VARFYLDNGARLEHLNPRGNMARPRQSFGMMVNHLCDLDRIELSHDKFRRGTVARPRALSSLL
jgi:malonyl-CoA decarboxylase